MSPAKGIANGSRQEEAGRASAPLVWMDLEMSGLDPASCRILEIATLITDADLEVIAEGPDLVVHQPDAVLEAMDDWNTRHHGESGLTGQVRASTISPEEAERRTLEFVRAHCAPRSSPLCGNSVGQDRQFLARYMADLEAFLHYRNVDVSTIKELCRRWYPEARPPEKRKTHRAMEDILESIEELRFYRTSIFRAGGAAPASSGA
jgi:oligoribonuclease